MGRVRRIQNSRVESGRVRSCSKSHGSGRAGSKGSHYQNLTGWVGPGQMGQMLEISRVGLGPVILARPNPRETMSGWVVTCSKFHGTGRAGSKMLEISRGHDPVRGSDRVTLARSGPRKVIRPATCPGIFGCQRFTALAAVGLPKYF